MSKNDKPIYTFSNAKIFILLSGIIITIIFCIIYFIIALSLNRIDYFSFFFNNITNHIFLTILAGFHVGLLGIGMLLIIVAFFNLSPKIKCYKDRFVVSLFLQKKKVIKYSEIKNIDVKIVYSSHEGFLSNKTKKECRVYFTNPVYNFYLSYPIKGYFDNAEYQQSKDKEFLLRRCVTNKHTIEDLISIFKQKYKINKPYLPEEDGI
jgi:hypothetical protein